MENTHHLKGVAVITGASGGIGGYLAQHLGSDYQIIGTYHQRRPSQSNGAQFYQVDLLDASSIDRFVAEVSPSLRNVVLVNSAGVSLDAIGHKMSEATWDEVVGTNLRGTFLMCRALLPIMRAQEWGRIINVSSVVPQLGVPGTAAYSASKAGLQGLSRTLAVENAAKGITVNCLVLGYISVGMGLTIKPDSQEQIKARIPMKRFGDVQNVVTAVRFLIDCDYITGTSVQINGGLL